MNTFIGRRGLKGIYVIGDICASQLKKISSSLYTNGMISYLLHFTFFSLTFLDLHGLMDYRAKNRLYMCQQNIICSCFTYINDDGHFCHPSQYVVPYTCRHNNMYELLAFTDSSCTVNGCLYFYYWPLSCSSCLNYQSCSILTITHLCLWLLLPLVFVTQSQISWHQVGFR